MDVWDKPCLFKIDVDELVRRCLFGDEIKDVLSHCHNSPYRGPYNWDKTATKVLQLDFYWPNIFKDAHEHCRRCDECQRSCVITKGNELPLQSMLEVNFFNFWGIDFVGPLPMSNNPEYILVVVDYMSKWVKAIATQKVDSITMVKFLKRNLFCRFGTPRVLISDVGSHVGERRKLHIHELKE